MNDGGTFHYDPFRTGYYSQFLEPPLDPTHPWGKYLTLKLGPIRGAPLFAEMPPGSPASSEGMRTLIIVATCRNEVYAFWEDQLFAGVITPFWKQAFPQIKPPSQRGGSNIPPPIGICGTPVLSLDNQAVYVLVLTEEWDRQHHLERGVYYIYQLDLMTGTVVQEAALRDPVVPGHPNFNEDDLDQRCALNLVQDAFKQAHLCATFADFKVKDEPPYRGWVVSIDPGALANQQYFPLMLSKNGSSARNGAGLWGVGGAAAGPDGSIYIATGNSNDITSKGGYWSNLQNHNQHPPDIGDYLQAVVRLTWSAQGKLTVTGWYMPLDAPKMNDEDLDLGGSSVMVIPNIDGQVRLTITSKKGDMFLLSALKGGHWGGELDRVQVFDGLPGVPRSTGRGKGVTASYQSSDGAYYVFVSGAGNPGLAAYTIENDAFKLAWKATTTTTGVPFGKWPGSPIVTSLPSGEAPLVWVLDDGNLPDHEDDPSFPNRVAIPVLRAFDALTGQERYNSSWASADALDASPTYNTSLHMPVMTCTHRSVLVGTREGLVCYGPLARFPDEQTLNLVVFHVDHRPDANRGFYRIGINLSSTGLTTGGWTWYDPNLDPGQRYQVPGWFGTQTQGAGIAVTDLDGNGHPDLIVFHIDDNGTDHDKGYYRVIRNLGVGGATGGWLPANKDQPIRVPGWFGQDVKGGGIAVTDLDGNGHPDLIVFHIDNKNGVSDKDKGHYRIGRHLDASGNVQTWISPIRAPGWYGNDVTTGSIAVADLDGNGRPDLFIFHIDNNGRDSDRGYYRIGKNLRLNGHAETWISPILVPGWYGRNVEGVGIAVADLDGDGFLDLLVFHIDHAVDDQGNPTGNNGYYRIGWKLDPISGHPQNGWSWYAGPASTSDFRVPGWFGHDNQHAGIAIAQFWP